MAPSPCRISQVKPSDARIRLSVAFLLVVALLVANLLTLSSYTGSLRVGSHIDESSTPGNTNATTTTRPQPHHCALNFYGLPRAFQSIVLPTIVENIIQPNAAYGCDVFVYYHHLEQESAGRSGHGGVIRADEIYQLESAVRQVATGYDPVVEFGRYTDQEFAMDRADLLMQIRTAKDKDGHPIYRPWKDKTFTDTAAENIVKMWHGQAGVWQLMQASAQSRGVVYDRVAMFRADVAFVTPIDIYAAHGVYDADNRIAVIPGFAKWPVNDRMIYGPKDAAAVWADQHFSLLPQHIKKIQRRKPGYGIHSEWFLELTILPNIRQLGFDVVEDEQMCFLRARADESVWLNDCGDLAENRRQLERLIGRKCRQSNLEGMPKKGVIQLECRQTNET